MSVFERCLEKCRARKGAVVYSDGEDRRVVSAAAKLIPVSYTHLTLPTT
mgnify:CR=1 FL=1